CNAARVSAATGCRQAQADASGPQLARLCALISLLFYSSFLSRTTIRQKCRTTAAGCQENSARLVAHARAPAQTRRCVTHILETAGRCLAAETTKDLAPHGSPHRS